MANQISLQASLIVLLMDDFTGKPITDSKVRVSIAGQKPPVKKEGGYYVFVNLDEKKVRIMCESNLYQKRTEEINLAQKERMEVVIIRLLPTAAYPISGAATCVTGRTRAGRKLLFWKEESKGYRLLSDYNAATEMIEIYAPTESVLMGRAFFMRDKKGAEKQFFRIIGKKQQQYRMDRKLSRDYEKTAAVVLPVFEVAADEKGVFFLMLPKEQESDGKIFCQAQGEPEQSFDLRTGKINTVIL